MSMKNSNNTIGNRTRDLPACSALPQLNALPRAPNRNEYQGISLGDQYDRRVELTSAVPVVPNVKLRIEA
jgi:hypothetical protein